ncbi:nose resistant to fluoxetine protein 6-like [Babylonia areolata]|uniref:nose resistant to fluoxetine protein 6-like n=1 Tax=Babylonia areolata TaxID=304850 RepID=UPI003FD1121A
MLIQAASAQGRPMMMHLCVPTSCSETDLYGLFQPALDALGSERKGITCSGPRDPKGDNLFIGVTTTLAVLALLCAAGTAYGIILDSREEKQQSTKQKEAKGFTNNGFVTNDDAPRKPDGGHVNDNLSNGDAPKACNGSQVKGSVPSSYVKHCEEKEKVDMTDIEGGVAKHHNGGVFVNEAASGSKVQSGSSRRAEEGVLSKMLLSFSVLRNGEKVLSCKQNPADIGCLHGIRVLSITWVILGHAFTMLGPATGNGLYMYKLMERFTFTVFPSGVLAVDTFFLLRLTPLYAVLLWVYIGIFPYLKEGPFQYTIGMDSETSCREDWYLNLLYINNLKIGDLEKMCFGWSWYLSNDMQFSFLAPLVLIPWSLKGSLKRVKVVGFVFSVAMILIHVIYTAVISYTEGISMFIANGNEYVLDIYMRPWSRVGPYAVGLLLGYTMSATSRKYTMGKVSHGVGKSVALTVVYVLYDNVRQISTLGPLWNTSQAAAYESVFRVLWAVCVAWVIFACSKGCGGFVNTLLSWSAWQPLSRLTYGVYLVHCVVLFVIGGNLKKPLYVDPWTVTTLSLAVTVLSYLASFIFSMLVEAPTLGLEKAVLGKIFRSKK